MVRVKDIRKELILMVAILLPLCLGISSCMSKERRQLDAVEHILESNPAKADTMLSSIPLPSGKHQRAWYAVLRTQADYKNYKPIVSDSLILTATYFYGTPYKSISKHRKYRAAMAWYSQGCVYSELKNDLAATDAYLKAKELYPDTLISYFARTEQNLGEIYLRRQMLVPAESNLKSCRLNAERLNNTKMSHYVTYRLGLCALYNRDFEQAEKIFSDIKNDSSYASNYRTGALLQMAKIRVFNDKDYSEALLLIDSYLKARGNMNTSGAALSLKAEAFYAIQEYDSAYYYYSESNNTQDIEIYTRCNNADKLTTLALKSGYNDKALEWYGLYIDYRDSINNIERTRDIEDIQTAHKEELAEQVLKNKKTVYLLTSIFLVLFFMAILLIAFTIYKRFEEKKIIKKQSELIRLEKEINNSSIELLQLRVKELSDDNSEARDVILELYRKRLNLCKNKFMQTAGANILIDFMMENSEFQFRKNEKNVMLDDLKESYNQVFADILSEVPDSNSEEMMTIVLKHLKLKNSKIADIFNITEKAVKQRYCRLAKRSKSDFINLFH